jgi:Alternative complex III, ActD subunit
MKARSGIAGELATEDQAVIAIGELRDQGLFRLEAFVPHPMPALDRALGQPRSSLARVAAAGALFGVIGGYFLQWLLNAYLYPVNSGGRPPHMPLAFVPISIEMGFLFGALSVFAGFLWRARLLRLWDPVFEIDGFVSATRDRIWVAAGADDPKFDAASVERAFREAGATRIIRFGGVR